MINYKIAKKYCSEDISLIENYEQAALDTTQVWHIHHKDEIDKKMLRSELIENNIYYGVPAERLIFLTEHDHRSLHAQNVIQSTRVKISERTLGKSHGPMSEEHKRKISLATSGKNNPQFGVVWSDERREKLSNTRKTKIANGEIKVDTSACHTEEACKKISDKAKARLANPANHPMFGKHQSEETKRKISEANKSRIPWNKGKKGLQVAWNKGKKMKERG